MSDILILEGARTPFCIWSGGTRADGQKGGALKPYDPFDLGAAALKEALKRSNVPGERLDKVVFANTYHVGPHACYGARYVGLRAGLPPHIPNLTVNLACGAGLQSIISSAGVIASGEGTLVGAVGGDSSSNIARNVFVPSFKDASCGQHIAFTAQEMARESGISRADQDRWSLQSHQRAAKAREKGYLAEEIVPIGELSLDDGILDKPEESYFAGAKLLFETGEATGANTHGVTDGGSALIMAEAASAGGLKAVGRYVTGAVVGVPPEKMARASVVAVQKALKQARLSLEDIDLLELNETFASQLLIDLKELGLPEEKVNVNGGAIAIGHPWAGSGPRLVMTLLKELRRRGLKRGAAAICVGAGSGIAVIVETV
jgi:acetyl-CoA C-acetyltransferase